MSDACRICRGPIVQAEGMPAPACVLCIPETTPLLDWNTAAHWGGGQPHPCRICGHDALLLDRNGKPCHKTCAEAELRYHARRVQAENRKHAVEAEQLGRAQRRRPVRQAARRM